MAKRAKSKARKSAAGEAKRSGTKLTTVAKAALGAAAVAAAGVAMRRMVGARRPDAQANAEAAKAGTKPVKAVAKKRPAKRK
jgi:hypothetical protein